MKRLSLSLLAALAFACVPLHAQDLQPATPESQGMDSAALAQLVEYGGNVKMDSLVVVRNGRVVLEAYYAPFRRDMLHRINSSTKAVAGSLAGIAIARGDLPGPQASVAELFGTSDERWSRVTLQHLLDMTSGLAWDEPLTSADFPSARDMERSANWSRYVLDRPFARAPGEAFHYNSGGSHLVMAAIARRTGDAQAYARRHLFEPIGITRHRWNKDPQGVPTGGYGLYLETLDMARFGLLYLQGGQWNGRQVIPRAWTERVFSPKTDMDIPGFRYADFWWSIPRAKAYFAAGFNRQLIMVLPELGVVAATTGRSNYPFHDLIAHLERAAKSAQALPEDAGAQALLQQKVAAAAAGHTPASLAASAPPGIQRGAWKLEDNRLGIRELALDFSTPQPTYRVKLRSREFGGDIGLNGRYGAGVDGVTPVFTRAAWKDSHTLEVEQHWPEEAGQVFYTIRFDADGRIAMTHTNQFGVSGTTAGLPTTSD